MIYLVHFDAPYHHARHYMGFTENLAERLGRHANGRGSRLLEVVTSAGIPWRVVRVWDGDRSFERRLKRRSHVPLLCPGVLGRSRAQEGELMSGPGSRYVEVPREALETFLTSKGFRRTHDSGNEIVYARSHDHWIEIKVKVYTSIGADFGTARGCGEDAIRVCLVWEPADNRRGFGLDKGARVYRTGTVEKILSRLYQRMREEYQVANEIVKRSACRKCGAPCYSDSGRCVVRECRQGVPEGRREPLPITAPTLELGWSGSKKPNLRLVKP